MMVEQDIYERLERFKRVNLITGCWLWIGQLDKDGYGDIQYKHKKIKIHRLAAHLYRSLALNSPLLVCHKAICPNKNCFNPEHTFDGTYSDNNTKTHCNRGHDMSVHAYRGPRGNRYCRECIKNSPSRVARRGGKIVT